MSRPQTTDHNGFSSPIQSDPEVEWVFTTRGANLVRIERLDKAANRRTEVTAEEYAAYAATYYAVYFAGVRDYAQAQAFSDTAAIQAFHQGVIQYLGAVGQT